jgi:hypothetical protein
VPVSHVPGAPQMHQKLARHARSHSHHPSIATDHSPSGSASFSTT